MKKTETKSTVLLAHHLKSLRMPTMLAECEKVAARCAVNDPIPDCNVGRDKGGT